MQERVINNRYEILTPTGWKNFAGIVHSYDSSEKARTIVFSDSTSITASMSHRWFVDGVEKRTSDLVVGDALDGLYGKKNITTVIDATLDEMYDVFRVEGNVFLTDDVVSHNCDELAFVPSTIADAMWTSMRPTLATGGRAIITSTPNSDEDLFARIWNEANMKYDDYGNEQELGKNGFFPFRAYWYEHPDRDEKWRLAEVGAIGLGKFNREYACLSGDTILTMQLIDGTVKDMTISDVFELLKIEEAIDTITPDNLSGILDIPEIEPLEDMGAYEDVAFFGIAED